MAKDWNDLNSGVWMARASDWGKQWLTDLWDKASGQGKHHPWAEQFDIQHWTHTHIPEAREHFLIVPQRDLQSYPGNTPGMGAHKAQHGWHPGDWMVHFAGCGDQAGRSCQREFMQFWELSGKGATETAEAEVASGAVRPFTPPAGFAFLVAPKPAQPGVVDQILGVLGMH